MHYSKRLIVELKSPRAKARIQANASLWYGVDLEAAFKAANLAMPSVKDSHPNSDAPPLCSIELYTISTR